MSNAIKWFEPILVLGPGRCGSSTVARILHTQCGVSMGLEFRKPDVGNAQGYYEDLAFKQLNDRILCQEITRADWLRSIEQLIIKRRARYVPWGIKDPRLADLWHRGYVDYFRNPRIIRCRRHHEMIIDSLQRTYGWTRTDAKRAVDGRENSIDKIVEGRKILEIDLSEHISDDLLCKILGTYMEDIFSAKQEKLSSNSDQVQQETRWVSQLPYC